MKPSGGQPRPTMRPYVAAYWSRNGRLVGSHGMTTSLAAVLESLQQRPDVAEVEAVGVGLVDGDWWHRPDHEPPADGQEAAA